MKRFRSTLATITLLVSGLLLGALRTPLAEPESTVTHPLPAMVLVEAPAVVAAPLADRFPQGSHLTRLSPGNLPGPTVDLTPEFFAVADPQVSFDASRVLFAAEKSRDSRWQIWEMNADGSAKRQLTHCPSNCFQPAYLPRNQIVYTMTAGKGPPQASAIYVSQANGADPHPITFSPGSFQVETVLRSGRLLVSGRRTLVTGGKNNEARVFYTLRPDGSGLTLFGWGSPANVVRSGATELDNGTVLFLKRQNPVEREMGGELAWIPLGALHNSVITPPNSVYGSAHALDGKRLVVTKAPSGSDSSGEKFGLYILNLATRTIGKPVYTNPKFSVIQAVPLEPSPIPLYYRSILHPDRKYGRVVCLNAYLSADAPHGRLVAHIARVRVITLQSDHQTQRVLGEAPVESDGSFYIKVPADHPLRFELLSRKGAVIRSQKSWIWACRGEDVPCLGCHESKARVPADHWPLALRRPDAPIPVGVSSIKQPAQH